MTNTKQRIIEVLEKGYLMSLGVVDDRGVWVADVIYVYDDELNIYWNSKTDSRHSKTIDKINNKVAGTITVTNNGEKDDLGVQVEGRAEKLGSFNLNLITKLYKKRGKLIPNKEDLVFKQKTFYKLTPTKIGLLDDKNFGRERQDLKI